MKKNLKGFTLIELLVVIAIIGLLSTLAVVSLNSAREKARDAKRLSDIKQISTVIEMAAANTASGGYDVLPDLCDAIGDLTTLCADDIGGAGNSADIVNIKDPSTPAAACVAASVATCGYAFGTVEDAADYSICFYTENIISATGAQGLHNVGPGGMITSGCP